MNSGLVEKFQFFVVYVVNFTISNMNQYESSINRKIIAFRYYAVSHKIIKLSDLVNSFYSSATAYNCVEISKAEALHKLKGSLLKYK